MSLPSVIERPLRKRKVQQRFAGHVSKGKGHRVDLPSHHPAAAEGRTLFPTRVLSVQGLQNVLVSGANARKIGDRIIKGKWAGYPVFTLTLEERATCPRSCLHWGSCFGSNMPFAKRIKNDAEFEERLGHELAVLNYKYPKGFAVRLHVLGDFYSVEYVKLWATFLNRFAALRVFGFSARWNMKDDPIADELVRLFVSRWDRFAIRFSNAPMEEISTVTVESESQVPADAVLCPQQKGQTQSCGSCALCWSSQKRIAFLQH